MQCLWRGVRRKNHEGTQQTLQRAQRRFRLANPEKLAVAEHVLDSDNEEPHEIAWSRRRSPCARPCKAHKGGLRDLQILYHSADRASLLTSWLRPSMKGMVAVCMDFCSLSLWSFCSLVSVLLFFFICLRPRLVNKLFGVAITGHHHFDVLDLLFKCCFIIRHDHCSIHQTHNHARLDSWYESNRTYLFVCIGFRYTCLWSLPFALLVKWTYVHERKWAFFFFLHCELDVWMLFISMVEQWSSFVSFDNCKDVNPKSIP